MILLRKIKVDDLKHGMCFSKPLYADPYNIVLEKDQPITETIISEINEWKIKVLITDGYRLRDKIIKNKKEKTEVVGTYQGSESKVKTVSDEKIIEEKLKKEKQHKKFLKELKTKDIIPEYQFNPKLQSLYSDAKEEVKNSILRIKEQKPVDKVALVKIVERIDKAIESSELELLNMIFQSDFKKEDYKNYLYTHHVNTCVFGIMLAKKLGVDVIKRDDLGIGALLHDIGMFIIPQEIIEKNETLSEGEYDKVKTHPFLGYKVLVQIGKLSQNIALISLHHQERYNGSGYPRGLSKDKISYFARIVSITSVFAALIENRTYRESFKPFNAITKLLGDFKDYFDPEILKVFVRTLGLYPPSTFVLLSNDYTGQVVKATYNLPKNPKVLLLYDNEGLPIEGNIVTDLNKKKELYIKRALSKFEFEKLIVDRHEKLQ